MPPFAFRPAATAPGAQNLTRYTSFGGPLWWCRPPNLPFPSQRRLSPPWALQRPQPLENCWLGLVLCDFLFPLLNKLAGGFPTRLLPYAQDHSIADLEIFGSPACGSAIQREGKDQSICARLLLLSANSNGSCIKIRWRDAGFVGVHQILLLGRENSLNATLLSSRRVLRIPSVPSVPSPIQLQMLYKWLVSVACLWDRVVR